MSWTPGYGVGAADIAAQGAALINPWATFQPNPGPPGAFSTQCGGGLDALNYSCWPQIPILNWFNPASSGSVAPPKAPTDLTTPPASGAAAQQTVDALLNQQMADQQALDASQVTTTIGSEVGGALSQAGDTVSSAAKNAVESLTSPWLWLGLGLGVFALVAIAGGGPRRYGR